MSKMVQQTSFDDYFIEGDPMLVKTNEFKENFGNDYFIGILTECDNHFTKESLTLMRELGEELLDSLSCISTRQASSKASGQPHSSTDFSLCCF